MIKNPLLHSRETDHHNQLRSTARLGHLCNLVQSRAIDRLASLTVRKAVLSFLVFNTDAGIMVSSSCTADLVLIRVLLFTKCSIIRRYNITSRSVLWIEPFFVAPKIVSSLRLIWSMVEVRFSRFFDARERSFLSVTIGSSQKLSSSITNSPSSSVVVFCVESSLWKV